MVQEYKRRRHKLCIVLRGFHFRSHAVIGDRFLGPKPTGNTLHLRGANRRLFWQSRSTETPCRLETSRRHVPILNYFLVKKGKKREKFKKEKKRKKSRKMKGIKKICRNVMRHLVNIRFLSQQLVAS